MDKQTAVGIILEATCTGVFYFSLPQLFSSQNVEKTKMSQTLIPNGAGGEIVLTEKLSDDLATLYCSDKYSDVTFLVEDENKRIERIPCKVCLGNFVQTQL